MIRKILKKIPGFRTASHILNQIRRIDSIDVESLNQQLQQILKNQYRLIAMQDCGAPQDIAETGFRCYSQFEEDGIILYVLSSIGMKTKRVVEICCGTGSECMAANLILNHGFKGYLFDGQESNVAAAQSFFNAKKDCLLVPPTVVHAWVTKENINKLLIEAGAVGEVDLLSLDLDGNDYYIWKAIEILNPRLCVFETSNLIPGNLSLTIPYEPDFDSLNKGTKYQDFRSVSLLAMKRLCEEKGYRLIGGHRHGFNVFFLRNDIATSLFPEVSIEYVHDNFWTKKSQEQRWPRVREAGWLEV